MNSISQNDEYFVGLKDGMEAGKKGENFIYFLAGCLLSYGIGVIFPLIFEPDVPVDYLIGKSAFYTLGFTNGYKKKARDSNFSKALSGCLVQLSVYFIMYMMLVSTDSNR